MTDRERVKKKAISKVVKMEKERRKLAKVHLVGVQVYGGAKPYFTISTRLVH